MERAKSFETIVINLNILRYIIYSKVKAGLYDVNKRSENFFCDLLNLVYGWKLDNLNKDGNNFPAIDLGSTIDRIGVQVTSQNDYKKIDNTLKKFDTHTLHSDYDRVIMFIITSKSNHSKEFVSATIGFDKEKDIMDIDDLLLYMENNLNTERTKELEKYILNEIPYYTGILTNANDLLSHRNDYKSFEARTYNKLKNYLEVEGNVDMFEEIKAQAKIIFEKLGKVSQKQRSGIVVVMTKGNGIKLNIYTWGDILTFSFRFETGDIHPLEQALDKAEILYYNEDENSPGVVMYDKDFWLDIRAMFNDNEITDFIINRNFSLLDA